MTKIESIYPVSIGSCRSLWLAVIHQALFDLVHTVSSDRQADIVSEAYRWFFRRNDGFAMVCNLAGLDVNVVRKRAYEIEANPSLLGHFHV